MLEWGMEPSFGRNFMFVSDLFSQNVYKNDCISIEARYNRHDLL